MRFLILILSLPILAASAPNSSPQMVDPIDLSSALSVFSAHATGGNGVRLNWNLDYQSPLITKFRIYRGYEEVGDFAVFDEIDAKRAADTVNYSLQDTTALPGVSYYYKLSALGQSAESVFPVVITAVPLRAGQAPIRELPPAAILPGNSILLYVRQSGHVILVAQTDAEKTYVDEILKPGIYQFAPPTDGHPISLRLEHEHNLKTTVEWPIP